MFSLQDIKYKQIVFIQTDGIKSNSLRLKNDNLVYECDQKIINQASIHRLLAVFVVGDTSITTKLIQKLQTQGISLFLLKRNLEHYASVVSYAEGNYLLRTVQYQQTRQQDLAKAKCLVVNKIQNQLLLLKSLKNSEIKLPKAKILLQQISEAENMTTLLGIEGTMSKIFNGQYFGSIGWTRRMPRVKADIPNLLMDIGYTYLFNLCESILRLFGFDTYRGVYHQLFFQRKSLACDIMEPFRCLIDKQILKSYNLKQIDLKDFKQKNGQYYLDYQKQSKYSGIFLKLLMDNRQDIYTYIQKYYRHFMKPEKNNFPSFKIKI
jgi:CRISP-associated protein Cas1